MNLAEIKAGKPVDTCDECAKWNVGPCPHVPRRCYICAVTVDQGWFRDDKVWCLDHRPVWSRA